jgi:hypothetical protein
MPLHLRFTFQSGEQFRYFINPRRGSNVQIHRILSLLLIASSLSLGIGGIFLFAYSLVPVVLVATTAVAVMVLLLLSLFVWKGNKLSINISTILGVFAPILSITTPAHVGVLEQIGRGGLISFLGILQLLGFFIFPIGYVILRLVLYREIALETALKSSKPLVPS